MIGYAHQAKGNREHSTVYLYGQEPSTLLIAGLWFLLLISAMGSCSYISNSHSPFLDYMVYYSKRLFETITWHVVWKQDTEMAAAGLWAGWGWFWPCRLRTMSGWNNPALQTEAAPSDTPPPHQVLISCFWGLGFLLCHSPTQWFTFACMWSMASYLFSLQAKCNRLTVSQQ